MKKRLEDMSLQELWELFPIVLVAPDPTWKKQFREEKKTLEKLLGKKALGIYHIGSTAVGTIVAKPIVDIIVETDDPKAAADILAGSGYIVMLRNEDRISLNKGYTVDGYADKVFHIHIRKPGDTDEIYFAKYLTEHADVAEEYGSLKKKLLSQYGRDRGGYTDAKTDFVKAVTERAKKVYCK